MNWLILVALPAMCLAQCISENDSKPRNDSSARIALSRGQQLFSLDMLRVMNQLKREDNIFFSPHSIYQSLLLAYFTSANNTENMLRKALYLPESQTKIETLHSYGMEKHFQMMRDTAESELQFKTVNRMFLAQQIEARKCMEELLHDELEKVNFQADPLAARNHINDWIANVTKDQIKELLPHDAVGSDSTMILANAAYFKGLWKSQFLPEMTKKALFYSSTKEYRPVKMMRQKGTFNHMQSERLTAHILELPYKGGDVSMIIILPRFEDNAIDKVIKLLTTQDLQEILEFESFYPRPIEVEIPKFTVEESIDLNAPFKQLGLEELFNSTSDFTALTGQDDGIHFSEAIHKAKVEVDEEGTVAAAATAVFSFRSSRPLDPTIFHANHPFVYLIYDKLTHNILFLGAYRHPEKPAKKAFMKN